MVGDDGLGQPGPRAPGERLREPGRTFSEHQRWSTSGGILREPFADTGRLRQAEALAAGVVYQLPGAQAGCGRPRRKGQPGVPPRHRPRRQPWATRSNGAGPRTQAAVFAAPARPAASPVRDDVAAAAAPSSWRILAGRPAPNRRPSERRLRHYSLAAAESAVELRDGPERNHLQRRRPKKLTTGAAGTARRLVADSRLPPQ